MRAAAAVALVLAGACARAPIRFPTGPGEPISDPAAALSQATGTCRSLTTLTAELSVSGRAGRQRIRGRVLAALATPSAIRLEGLAPFGPPAFILVAPGTDRDGTLILPRDERIVTRESVAAMIDALTGVRLGADDLHALLAGCVDPNLRAASGTRYGKDWIRIEGDEGTSIYIRSDNPRQIAGGKRGPLTFQYGAFIAGFPREIRLLSTGSGGSAGADLTLRVSDLESNAALEPEVFAVKITEGLRPITLEELRKAGPLGESDQQ
jgi:hypothetical protein